jgi:hypothetical protein
VKPSEQKVFVVTEKAPRSHAAAALLRRAIETNGI